MVQDGFIVDKEDSSVTRSAEYLEGLFKAGGLNVVRFVKRSRTACVRWLRLRDKGARCKVANFRHMQVM